MSFLPQTLKALVERGANIDVDNALPATLMELALIAQRTGAHITVSGGILPNTAKELADLLGNQVTFVSRKGS